MNFRYVLIVIWIVCGLVDVIKGPVRHQKEEGGEEVDYACEGAFWITLFYGLVKIAGCG